MKIIYITIVIVYFVIVGEFEKLYSILIYGVVHPKNEIFLLSPRYRAHGLKNTYNTYVCIAAIL